METIGIFSVIAPMGSSTFPKGILLSLPPRPCQTRSFRAHSHSGNPSSAPDVSTFNSLILIFEGKTTEAVELFDELGRNGEIEPDEFMFEMIISWLCKQGNTGMATRWLRIMDEGGYCPNTRMYNMIIHRLCEDGMVDYALNFFSEMKEKGINPDAVTGGCLSDGLCKSGRVKEAARIFGEMLDIGICLSVCTINNMIDAPSKQGKVKEREEVIELLKEMILGHNSQ